MESAGELQKKKVLIIGATGMLGSAVYGVLKDKYSLVLAARDRSKVGLLEKAYGGTNKHKIVEFDAGKIYQDFVAKKGYPGKYLQSFLASVGDVDYVINAVGLVIAPASENPVMAFFINGALPHILANAFGDKLIHITTDCAFNGTEGFPYDENSPKTPVDIYGLSKSLGEPDKCLTIRTSIIGRELEGFTGLLEWFLHQPNKEVDGFAEHYWNGITTKQFGKICDQIMSDRDNYPKTGIYHVFSTTVSKYEMLQTFKEKYKLDVKINKNRENELNRTLGTVKELNGLLKVSSFGAMVDDL
jgi:dTDP-4-dehydrorhamnose reductase